MPIVKVKVEIRTTNKEPIARNERFGVEFHLDSQSMSTNKVKVEIRTTIKKLMLGMKRLGVQALSELP